MTGRVLHVCMRIVLIVLSIMYNSRILTPCFCTSHSKPHLHSRPSSDSAPYPAFVRSAPLDIFFKHVRIGCPYLFSKLSTCDCEKRISMTLATNRRQLSSRKIMGLQHNHGARLNLRPLIVDAKLTTTPF